MEIKTFNTGAVREVDEERLDWTILPWEQLQRVVRQYMFGAKKYARDNWKKGQPSERYKRSLARHLVSVLKNEKDEDHLAAVIFNALALMYNEDNNIGEKDEI